MLALLRPCSLTGRHTKHLRLKLLTAAMRTRGHQQAKKAKMMTMGSAPAKRRISQMERSPPEGVCSSGKIALLPDRWGIFRTHSSCACDMHCCREGLGYAHVAGSCYGVKCKSVCQITSFPLGLIRVPEEHIQHNVHNHWYFPEEKTQVRAGLPHTSCDRPGCSCGAAAAGVGGRGG